MENEKIPMEKEKSQEEMAAIQQAMMVCFPAMRS